LIKALVWDDFKAQSTPDRLGLAASGAGDPAAGDVAASLR
jgi:hypothetical protein